MRSKLTANQKLEDIVGPYKDLAFTLIKMETHWRVWADELKWSDLILKELLNLYIIILFCILLLSFQTLCEIKQNSWK